jgi:CO/xanthine dehydrogenase Mo-binding subunit
LNQLTNALRAISHPTPRAIVGQLASGLARLLDNAEPFDVALNVVQHIPAAIAQDIGDVDRELANASKRLEASCQVPFLAHAAMEPMNCTVEVRRDACEIWVGTQVCARAQPARHVPTLLV